MKKKELLILPILTLCGCNLNQEFNGVVNCINIFEIKDNLDNVTSKTARVIILYGQSNASGVSSNQELLNKNESKYQEYDNGYSKIKINYFDDNGANTSDQKFVESRIGQGCSQNHFGPEIGIAEIYNQAETSDDIFIIKYAWGGTCLNNQWLNQKYGRGELYYAALNFTKANLNYLISKGYQIKIDGICWMQGESDSLDSVCNRYYENTKSFVNLLRNDLAIYSANIKFVDAYIEDISIWKNYQIINAAKYRFSTENNLNSCIDTIELGLTTAGEPTGNPDLAHYDSLSMVTLGNEFARKLLNW